MYQRSHPDLGEDHQPHEKDIGYHSREERLGTSYLPGLRGKRNDRVTMKMLQWKLKIMLKECTENC